MRRTRAAHPEASGRVCANLASRTRRCCSNSRRRASCLSRARAVMRSKCPRLMLVFLWAAMRCSRIGWLNAGVPSRYEYDTPVPTSDIRQMPRRPESRHRAPLLTTAGREATPPAPRIGSRRWLRPQAWFGREAEPGSWTLRRSRCLQRRLKRSALRLQERVGYPVPESQQAGPGQC